MIINRHNMEIISLLRGKEASESIQCLHVDMESGKTVVTDRVAMVAVSVPNDVTDEYFPSVEGFLPATSPYSFSLNVNTVQYLLGMIPKKHKIPKIPVYQCAAIGARDDKGNVSVGVMGDGFPTAVRVPTVGEKFPDYRSVLQKCQSRRPKSTITVDSDRLISILKLFGGGRVMIQTWGEADPIKISAERSETGQKLEALLMPMMPISKK